MIHSSPQRRVAIIKYARNGSSIAIEAASHWGCWEPDFEADEGERRNINQYDHAIATIRNALSVTDIDGDGENDQLTPRGIVWMQGESDAANSREVANRYSCNLKRLIDLLRAALRYDDLPVVIGRISDSGQNERGKIWKHGDIVRDQQEQFVQEDPAAALVTATDEYKYSDRFHYDSEGYLDLGHEFAKAILCLQSSVSNSEQQ